MRQRLVGWALAVSAVSVALLALPLVVASAVSADQLTTGRVTLLAVAFGLVALVAAAGLGVLAGRAMTERVATLEERAEKLGSGQTRGGLQATGLPEVDRVAELLE